MKKLKPIASLLLVCLLLAVCSSSAFAEGTLDTELPVRVITLNGTTGFGMAGQSPLTRPVIPLSTTASRSTPTLPMSRPLW